MATSCPHRKTQKNGSGESQTNYQRQGLKPAIAAQHKSLLNAFGDVLWRLHAVWTWPYSGPATGLPHSCLESIATISGRHFLLVFESKDRHNNVCCQQYCEANMLTLSKPRRFSISGFFSSSISPYANFPHSEIFLQTTANLPRYLLFISPKTLQSQS